MNSIYCSLHKKIVKSCRSRTLIKSIVFCEQVSEMQNNYILIFGLLFTCVINFNSGNKRHDIGILPNSRLYHLLRTTGVLQQPYNPPMTQNLQAVSTYFNYPGVQRIRDGNNYSPLEASNAYSAFHTVNPYNFFSLNPSSYSVNQQSLVLSPYGVFYNPSQFHGYFVPLLPNQNIPGVNRDDEEDNIYKNRDCLRYGRVGTCDYDENECENRGGEAHQYCPDIRKQCCLFYHKKCDIVTKGNVIHIENEAHPLSTLYSSSCKYTIQKSSKDICGFRFIFDTVVLPGSIGDCEDISLEMSGVPNVKLAPICGSLSGLKYDVLANSINEVDLKLKISTPKFVSFKITVKQLKCGEAPKILWPLSDPTEVAVLPSMPTDTPSKTKKPEVVASTGPKKPEAVKIPPSVPVVPANKPKLLSCGISSFFHSIPKTSSSVRASEVQEAEGESEELDKIKCVEETCPDNILRNPLLTSDVWKVPTVNQSELYEAAGEFLPLDGRITFGKKTKQFENPWQIVIYVNGRFHCSGSIISRSDILTAAHCVNRLRHNPTSMKITLGDYDVKSQTDGPNLVGVAKKIIVHEAYSARKLQNDIAIIRLKDRLTFTRRVSPICLPDSDIQLDGKLVTVTGWGRNENNLLQPVLMKHTAAVLSNEVCNQRWKSRAKGKNLIVKSMLCMDPQDGDSCKGDSGGPCIMEYPKGSKKFTQVGLVSFGSASCTDKKLPGVYTRIGNMLPWIKKHMKT